MISPISSTHTNYDNSVSQTPPRPAPTPPPAETPKSGEVSRDQVTLKSAGNVDHD